MSIRGTDKALRPWHRLIVASLASPGTGSVSDLVCTVMPDLITGWVGHPCADSAPAAVTILRDNAVAADFCDPPGVVGGGAPPAGPTVRWDA